MSRIISGREIHSLQTNKTVDITSHDTLVEVELRRESLYEEMIVCVRRWILDYSSRTRLTDMQLSHILLRYIFNKKATKPSVPSDPVFVTGTSKLARCQLQRDLKNVHPEDVEELAGLIDEELEIAARKIRSEKFRPDKAVTLSSAPDDQLVYRNRSQVDFVQLGQRHGPKYYNAAFALGLRYTYLCLTGHGLARAYKEDTNRSADDPLACEGFASAFNHYFDRYYSAFPDLEAFFGSRGNFFQIDWEKEPSNMTYYLCPPFDEALMQLCVDDVLTALQKHSASRATFVFSIPGSWTDFSALETLKKSSYVRDLVDYPKGKLPFIDYMATREKDRIIYPTDICVITLSTEAEEKKVKRICTNGDDKAEDISTMQTTSSKRREDFDQRKDDDSYNANGTKRIKYD